MNAKQEFDDVERTLRAIRAFTRIFRRVTDQITQELDIPSILLTALIIVEHNAPCRIGIVAEKLHVDQSVGSRHVKALMKAGLIEQIPDPLDGRARRLTLTEAGVAATTRVNELHRKRTAFVLREWDHERISVFAQDLEDFVEQTEEWVEHAYHRTELRRIDDHSLPIPDAVADLYDRTRPQPAERRRR